MLPIALPHAGRIGEEKAKMSVDTHTRFNVRSKVEREALQAHEVRGDAAGTVEWERERAAAQSAERALARSKRRTEPVPSAEGPIVRLFKALSAFAGAFQHRLGDYEEGFATSTRARERAFVEVCEWAMGDEAR
jgi:hypothetical protein